MKWYSLLLKTLFPWDAIRFEYEKYLEKRRKAKGKVNYVDKVIAACRSILPVTAEYLLPYFTWEQASYGDAVSTLFLGTASLITIIGIGATVYEAERNRRLRQIISASQLPEEHHK